MLSMVGLLKFWNFLVKNRQIILTAGLAIFMFLYLQQCNRIKTLKNEKQIAIDIAENNRKAMEDSSIVLLATRDQIESLDKDLANKVKLIDSISNLPPKTVTVVKVIDNTPEIITNNYLKYNKETGMYELLFTATDSVKTIEGLSSFTVDTTGSKLKIKPYTTTITRHRLNFGLIISEHLDDEERVSRLSIHPVFMKPNGTLTDAIISPNKLNLSIRGVELLDNPYEYPKQTLVPNKRGKWALGVSPISAGLFYAPKTNSIVFGIGPSISVTYSPF